MHSKHLSEMRRSVAVRERSYMTNIKQTNIVIGMYRNIYPASKTKIRCSNGYESYMSKSSCRPCCWFQKIQKEYKTLFFCFCACHENGRRNTSALQIRLSRRKILSLNVTVIYFGSIKQNDLRFSCFALLTKLLTL